MTKPERNFDDESYDEVEEERLREQDPDEKDRAYFPVKASRGDRIRTCDLVLPKHPRYQAAPRPVFINSSSSFDL